MQKYRQIIGGKNFGGKILAGKFWRENFGGNNCRENEWVPM
jgi:hypothetical protein